MVFRLSSQSSSSRGPRRAVLSACVLAPLLCALCAFAEPGTDSDSFTEYQIKAGFLYNFLMFTEFPLTKTGQADNTVVIGFLGDESLREAFKPVDGRQVGDRRLVVQTYQNVRQIGPCHILFVGKTAQRLVPAVLQKLSGSGTLTVGETDDFTRLGGAIRFIRQVAAKEEGERSYRLRFEVNLDAAEHEGLRFRAQFLRLAEVVRYGREE